MKMDTTKVYYPPKQIGTIIHILLILVFSSCGAWGIWGVSRVQVALELLPYLALIFLFLATVPFLIYLLYALHRSEYLLERGGIKLQWGWRSEIIPMERVNWVHHLADLEESPPFPWIRWPGAIIGRRRFQRGPIVEFLASSLRNLVVISAGDGYFVISPRDGDDFIHNYHHFTELGSLTQISEESLQPSLIFVEVTGRRPLLALLISGGLLNISLLIWVLLVIPNREVISLGFNPAGIPKEALGSVRLILFPIFSAIAYLANLVMGLILFQNEENRSMAHILWLGSLLIAILFHIALLFILS